MNAQLGFACFFPTRVACLFLLLLVQILQPDKNIARRQVNFSLVLYSTFPDHFIHTRETWWRAEVNSMSRSCKLLGLRHKGPGAEGDNIASRAGLHRIGDMSHCLQARQAGQAQGWWPGSTKRSSSKFEAMRQAQGQAKKSVHGSWSKLMGPLARDRHNCSWAEDRHTYNIAQAETGDPGLSLNRPPEPTGRGYGLKPQMRLVRAIKNY